MRISSKRSAFLCLLLSSCHSHKGLHGPGADAGALAGSTAADGSLAGGSDRDSGLSPGGLSAGTTTSLSFGQVTLGSSSPVRGFVLTNTGRTAIGVVEVSSDSREFAIQNGLVGNCIPRVTTLSPGASCIVSVVFTPNGAGDRSATMTFSDSSGVVGSLGSTGVGVTSSAPGRLAVLAGNLPSGEGSVDGTGTAARFSSPLDLAVDEAGNIFVADYGNHAIRKVTQAGVVTTFAGTMGQSGKQDGQGSAARFDHPRGLAIDQSGNLFVSDTNNGTVRKITPDGVVSTAAGTPLAEARYSGADLRSYSLGSLAVDDLGNILVVERNGSTLRKISPEGKMTVLAQMLGIAGSRSERFSGLSDVTIEQDGNLLVADGGNSVIRKIWSDDTVSTFAGALGSSGSIDGSYGAARFTYPNDLVVDQAGNVLVADSNTIRRIAREGMGVTTLVGKAGAGGSADGAGSTARFRGPSGLALDRAGNLFLADAGNNTIRQVRPDGTVSTIAGRAVKGHTDGTGADALFEDPQGVAMDRLGNVFVADTKNEVIRRVTPGGVVTTIAGKPGFEGSADGAGEAARFSSPVALAVAEDGSVVVADQGNETIRKISKDGVVTTLAGLAGSPGNTDGLGAEARFRKPTGVTVDRAGNVFVSDAGNDIIRKITPDGMVTTFARASASSFNGLRGIAADAAGNLFVANIGNNTICKITPDGTVTTLVGEDPRGCSDRQDDPCFPGPDALTVDAAGNIFVADLEGSIRKITPSGAVSTVVGVHHLAYGSLTSPGPLPASLEFPEGVAVDPLTGNLAITVDSAVMVVNFLNDP